MKLIAPFIILLGSVFASGCGSMLASVEANPIEDDPSRRTMAQRLEDESIEIKSVVNIHAADTGYDEAHIIAVSYNGFVLLAGQVDSEHLKTLAAEEGRVVYLMGLVSQAEARRIADVAASVTGVRRVVQLFEILP